MLGRSAHLEAKILKTNFSGSLYHENKGNDMERFAQAIVMDLLFVHLWLYVNIY
jgi:hypothetical protein